MHKLSMNDLHRKTVEEFKAAPKTPIVVVLDNIRSMYNVGSIFRTSDAFLVEAVYLCGYTPRPPHREIYKTALGATETVSWKYFPNTLEAVSELKKAGYILYGIEQVDNSVMLDSLTIAPEQKTALILGNEVEGVDEEVLQHCDANIEIPQWGTKHSLNVSIAAGIALWELVKMYKSKK